MRENLIGQQFNHLKVIGFNEESKKWICKCDCGNTTEVTSSNLRLGNTKSCGHVKNGKGIKKQRKIKLLHEQIGQLYVVDVNEGKGIATVKCLQCRRISKMPIQDLIKMKSTRRKSYTCGIDGCEYEKKNKKSSLIKVGTKFGDLVVLKRIENKVCVGKKSTSSIPMFLCECKCGNQVEVQGRYLISGRTKSCGCLKRKNFLDKDFHKKVVNSQEAKKLYEIYMSWQKKYRQPTKSFQENVINKKIKFFPELKYTENAFKSFVTWACVNCFDIKNGRIYLERKDYNEDFNVTNCYWTDKKTRGY